jgi:hypothetical protein
MRYSFAHHGRHRQLGLEPLYQAVEPLRGDLEYPVVELHGALYPA